MKQKENRSLLAMSSRLHLVKNRNYIKVDDTLYLRTTFI